MELYRKGLEWNITAVVALLGAVVLAAIIIAFIVKTATGLGIIQ